MSAAEFLPYDFSLFEGYFSVEEQQLTAQYNRLLDMQAAHTVQLQRSGIRDRALERLTDACKAPLLEAYQVSTAVYLDPFPYDSLELGLPEYRFGVAFKAASCDDNGQETHHLIKIDMGRTIGGVVAAMPKPFEKHRATLPSLEMADDAEQIYGMTSQLWEAQRDGHLPDLSPDLLTIKQPQPVRTKH